MGLTLKAIKRLTDIVTSCRQVDAYFLYPHDIVYKKIFVNGEVLDFIL